MQSIQDATTIKPRAPKVPNPDSQFVSDREAAAWYAVSRPTIWRWVSEGHFPKPIKLSPGCSRWRKSDLLAWEAARALEG